MLGKQQQGDFMPQWDAAKHVIGFCHFKLNDNTKWSY